MSNVVRLSLICPKCGSAKIVTGPRKCGCGRCGYIATRQMFRHGGPPKPFAEHYYFSDGRPRDGIGSGHIVPIFNDEG